MSNPPYDPEHDPDLTHVLFEIVAIGNSVKVSAIDPATNTEVSVVGSIATSAYSLKMNALRKLKAKLRKAGAPDSAKPLKGQMI